VKKIFEMNKEVDRKDPAFKRVVDHFLKSKPKPHNPKQDS